MSNIDAFQQFLIAAGTAGGAIAIGAVVLDTYSTYQSNKGLGPDEQGYRQPYFFEFNKDK